MSALVRLPFKSLPDAKCHLTSHHPSIGNILLNVFLTIAFRHGASTLSGIRFNFIVVFIQYKTPYYEPK